MPESITSITEIKDKEALDFKVEVGANKDGDKIVKLFSKELLDKDYKQIIEVLATEYGDTVFPIDERTEVERVQSWLEITTLAFTEKEKDTIRDILKRIADGDTKL